MRKLRIAFVSVGNLIHIGPYIEYFRGRGHDVHWLAYGTPPTRTDWGIKIYDLSGGANNRRQLSKWRYFMAGWRARKLLREISPDIVHGHYVTSAGVICLIANRRPYILSARGSDLLLSSGSFVWRPLLRTAFKGSTLVHVVSSQLAEVAMSLGVPRDKIFVATQGIDLERFAYQCLAPTPGPLRIVCTRHLNEIYDPLTIVDACRILKDRGFAFYLTFAATGTLEKEVRRQIAEAGLVDCVSLLGGYKNADLPKLLHENQVYVSASKSDGTSICLMEAMASGLVPVVSRIPSNLDWLEDGRTALMFDCGDAEQLADGIIRIGGQLDYWRGVTQTNRQTVEERANQRKNMLLLEERYNQIVFG